jgi:hypothetical protein
LIDSIAPATSFYHFVSYIIAERFLKAILSCLALTRLVESWAIIENSSLMNNETLSVTQHFQEDGCLVQTWHLYGGSINFHDEYKPYLMFEVSLTISVAMIFGLVKKLIPSYLINISVGIQGIFEE